MMGRTGAVEDQVREAILTELGRQSEDPDCPLTVHAANGRLTVNGDVDLDALVFVIVGSQAGGP